MKISKAVLSGGRVFFYSLKCGLSQPMPVQVMLWHRPSNHHVDLELLREIHPFVHQLSHP
ncbi:hypothetical protein ACHAW6_009883 [Cyclotella cf. meneghiniana]